jgi:hypothetical protein
VTLEVRLRVNVIDSDLVMLLVRVDVVVAVFVTEVVRDELAVSDVDDVHETDEVRLEPNEGVADGEAVRLRVLVMDRLAVADEVRDVDPDHDSLRVVVAVDVNVTDAVVVTVPLRLGDHDLDMVRVEVLVSVPVIVTDGEREGDALDDVDAAADTDTLELRLNEIDSEIVGLTLQVLVSVADGLLLLEPDGDALALLV